MIIAAAGTIVSIVALVLATEVTNQAVADKLINEFHFNATMAAILSDSASFKQGMVQALIEDSSLLQNVSSGLLESDPFLDHVSGQVADDSDLRDEVGGKLSSNPAFLGNVTELVVPTVSDQVSTMLVGDPAFSDSVGGVVAGNANFTSDVAAVVLPDVRSTLASDSAFAGLVGEDIMTNVTALLADVVFKDSMVRYEVTISEIASATEFTRPNVYTKDIGVVAVGIAPTVTVDVPPCNTGGDQWELVSAVHRRMRPNPAIQEDALRGGRIELYARFVGAMMEGCAIYQHAEESDTDATVCHCTNMTASIERELSAGQPYTTCADVGGGYAAGATNSAGARVTRLA